MPGVCNACLRRGLHPRGACRDEGWQRGFGRGLACRPLILPTKELKLTLQDTSDAEAGAGDDD